MRRIVDFLKLQGIDSLVAIFTCMSFIAIYGISRFVYSTIVIIALFLLYLYELKRQQLGTNSVALLLLLLSLFPLAYSIYTIIKLI